MSRNILDMWLCWIHVCLQTLLCVVVLGLTIVPGSRADQYDWEFRPGPNVPTGFTPTPDIDASGMDLSGSHFIGMDLRHAKFERSCLTNSRFLQVYCTNHKTGASFRGADLRNVIFEEPDVYAVCDFTNALINGIVVTGGHEHFLSIDQILSTKSYKIRDLSNCYIMGEYRRGVSSATIANTELMPMKMNFAGFALQGATFRYGDFTECDFTDANMDNVSFHRVKIKQQQLTQSSIKGHDGQPIVRRSYIGMHFFSMDLSGWDFTGADLRKTSFEHVNLHDAKFNNADIRGSRFDCSVSNNQFYSTKSYQEGNLLGIEFIAFDFSTSDISRQNMTDVRFISCIFTNTIFTDAIITNAYFRKCKGLTLDQIKSTWNYKHGRMEGIVLPKEIAEALAAEKR